MSEANELGQNLTDIIRTYIIINTERLLIRIIYVASQCIDPDRDGTTTEQNE